MDKGDQINKTQFHIRHKCEYKSERISRGKMAGTEKEGVWGGLAQNLQS